ncbi:potassium-transporting ATPase subunit C [Kibdelosporangium lantanae]|uniref:Potassium-transporting ATPase subunit C n=1 Tax=Kibdelosporangium lantanae TaxID=1497396 RepID=A0ABW3MH55_9PSEU
MRQSQHRGHRWPPVVRGSRWSPRSPAASASGLDPQISPAYAELQVARVARENGVPEDIVRKFVTDNTTDRGLGVLGDPGVNVLKLNLAVQAVKQR